MRTSNGAPQRVKEGLFPGELLFAFLDDTRCADMLARELSEHAVIQLNEGKVRPPHMEDFGPEVWNEEGVKILGTPIGSDRFIETVMSLNV